MKPKYIIGHIETAAGKIPKISCTLTILDRIRNSMTGHERGRRNYKVLPGLYAIGNPNVDSKVLATANYKLTFDIVRQGLENSNIWLLILDTNGINVWCSSAAGVFGTEELLKKIKETQLDKIISKKEIIIPPLGIQSFSSSKTKKDSGFDLVLGPADVTTLKQNTNHK